MSEVGSAFPSSSVGDRPRLRRRYTALGFFSSGYFSGMGPFLTELFPTRLRGSGQGFAYNFGRGIGALFPTLVGYLSYTMSLANAMALFAVIAYGLMFIAAAMLPETRGKVLQAYA